MRARVLRILLLALAGGLAAVPLFAQPALTGPEIAVDPGAAVDQSQPAAAADAAGNLLVVWSEPRESAGRSLPAWLRGRRFDASGTPLGPVFTIAADRREAAYAPHVAADGDGGFVVVWRSGDWQSGKVRGLHLDASGRFWRRVISISGPLPTPVAPRVAADGVGGFWVVWRRAGQDNLRGEILARRFNAAGIPFGPAWLIAAGGADVDRVEPAVAAQPDGDFAVAWSVFDARSSDSDVLVRGFDRAGAPLGPARRIRPDSVPVSEISPSLAPAPGGGFLAVWTDFDPGNPAEVFSIHSRRLDRTGLPLGSPRKLNDRPSSLEAPAIMVDAQGLFFAVWGERLEGRNHLRGRLLGAEGEPLGPATGVHDSTPGEAVDPAAVASGDGSFTVFWRATFRSGDRRDGRGRILGQRLVEGGGPGVLRIDRARLAVLEGEREAVELQVLRRDGNEGAVSADFLLRGVTAGAWTISFGDGDSTPRTISILLPPEIDRDESILASLVRPAGGAVLGAPRRSVVEVRDGDVPSPLLAAAGVRIEVSAAEKYTRQYSPAIASDASGGFAVSWIWEESADGFHGARSIVQGQRFDASGAPVYDFGSGWNYDGRFYETFLAMHPEGDLFAAWSVAATRDDPPVVVGERLDVQGLVTGVFDLGEVVPVAIAPSRRGGLLAVAGGRDSDGSGLFVHRFDRDGAPIGSPIRVSGPVLDNPPQADIASDGAGNFVVVWAVPHSGGAPAGIFARRFNASGAPRGAAFQVGPGGSGHDTAPAVDMDSSGRFAVAWQREDDGSGPGIVARAFDAAGAPRSGEILVNSRTAGDQLYPDVAVQGGGRFLVVWQDGSWDEDEMIVPRAQYFDPSGARLGGDFEISPYGTAPTVSTDDAGRFVAVWEDRDVRPCITARFFPASGTSF